jgi:hypothetical protein
VARIVRSKFLISSAIPGECNHMFLH